MTKRYFREQPRHPRTHIHVRQTGSWAEQFALLFRDYLREHPEDATEYAETKMRLAKRNRCDRQAYNDAKVPRIWSIMRNASEYRQVIGWQPGKPDY